MSSFNLVPIIILIAVLLIISSIVGRLNNSGKKVRWFFFGYLSLLVLSAIVYFLLPMEETQVGQMSTHEEFLEEMDEFYQKLNTGELDEIDPSYVLERWEFAFDGDALSIELGNQEDLNAVPIEVVAVEELQQEVIATYYQNSSHLLGISIAEYLSLPSIDLKHTTLEIIEPAPNELYFSSFKSTFPFRQYSGEKLMPDDIGYSSEIIIIQVPEGVSIEADEQIYVRE
ncbi:hypothetical protein D8M04_15505 [Oceanobacillus piezotolerans]|uniref:Uncharacterized protein n=1 Tax=Oceanobacillus piezotolerans TaxID=2448030 RepID=A0A498D2T3_9BACI|nr:hypothetical protein [Oceanobacillus piezotolerans]RLL41993.1 hypothetical protein D8M04_15505 [Oceanobacillus piezotolerans]